jgi:Uma2 family endonuclease
LHPFRDGVERGDGDPDPVIRASSLGGEIFAKAGGTPEHAAMAAEAIGQLRDALQRGPCRVFTSDLGVRVLATGLSTYPDASIVCGPMERDPDRKTTITNPRVVLEVTSDSTEDYDRGEKLEHYKQIPSLRAVVIVSHREPLVEVWSRSAESSEWQRTEARAGLKARLEILASSLDVDTVYGAAQERR